MADRGRLWTNAELRALLAIWGQENIQQQLVEVTWNDTVFARIVKELGRQGFHRSVQQSRAKPKALKKKISDRARRSGAGNESEDEGDSGPVDFPYHSLIDTVVTGRPSVTPVHLLDSDDSEVAQVFNLWQHDIPQPLSWQHTNP